MPSHDQDSQFKFLISCIKHVSSPGKVDFGAVAHELGIVSKGAAAKRYERLMRAHGVTSSSLRNPNNVLPGGTNSGMDSKNGMFSLGKSLAPGVGLSPAKKRKLEAALEGRDDDEDIKPKMEDGVLIKVENVNGIGVGRFGQQGVDILPPLPTMLQEHQQHQPHYEHQHQHGHEHQYEHQHHMVIEGAPMVPAIGMGGEMLMMDGSNGLGDGLGGYYTPEYVPDGGDWCDHHPEVGPLHDVEEHHDHPLDEGVHEGADVYWDGLTRFEGHAVTETV